jgi:hypothetical protein
MDEQGPNSGLEQPRPDAWASQASRPDVSRGPHQTILFILAASPTVPHLPFIF